MISCEEDSVDVEQQEVTQKAIFETSQLNKSDIVNRIDLQDALSKAKEQLIPSVQLKSAVYDSLNNIWIDEDHISYVSSGDYESYTFGILDSDTTKLKNLLFSKEVDSTYTSYIITYDLNYILEDYIIAGTIPDHLTSYVTYREITTDFQLRDCVGEWRSTTYITIVCPGDAGSGFGSGTGIPVEEDPDAGSESVGGGSNNGTNPPPSNETGNSNSGIDNGSNQPCLSFNNGDCRIVTNPVLPISLNEVSDNTQSLFDSFNDPSSGNYNPDVYEFIQSFEQNELRNDINNYIRSERNSLEAQGFAVEATIACEKGAEVDFENKSIYDETVPECLKDIINDFKPSQNGYTLDFTNLDQSLLNALNLPGDILSLFDNEEGYAVKINVEPNLVNDNPINAQTGRATSGKMSIITFNADYLNRATDLAIARTAIHELVHAYLQYVIQHVPNRELGESLDALILQSNLGVLNGDPQHVLMAEQFVNSMALSLANSDGFQHPPIEYQRLAWSGAMFASDAFAQLDPLEQPNIISRNFVEEGESRPNVEFPLLGTKTCL
ncbi:hypothetical protein LY01_00267 [Nonlabens xylanidelens]|uniref:SprT-like family protein n=1 Tax=Nonlabens xylanidelens TaxID=191564 RepID=A0A2S6IQC6_9FLAO|nr:hypothetical protein LY01_00267 [Nonlabens xylanidelens]PQJ18166.1 hypothetical protein BST94_09180 [Nonlabens xylanidelens]